MVDCLLNSTQDGIVNH